MQTAKNLRGQRRMNLARLPERGRGKQIRGYAKALKRKFLILVVFGNIIPNRSSKAVCGAKSICTGIPV